MVFILGMYIFISIICELKHICPLMCAQQCAPCKTPVLKKLVCGHDQHLPCSLEPTDPLVKCKVQISVTMPHCGHEYNCQKPCAKAKKGCSVEMEGGLGPHQYLKKCYEDCEDCQVQIVKKRSNCKHSERVLCNQNVDEKPCRKNCARILQCGHFCKKKCHEECGDCRQKVKKKIPACGHEVTVACSEDVIREMCGQQCERTLECGHPCRERCAAPCDPTRCDVVMPRKFDSICGHKVALPCYAFSSVFTSTVKPEVLLQNCTEPCNATLACGHLCGGTCSGCVQGRMHAPCTQTCNQIIICGHQCKEPCNQICPPCTKPCEVMCKHSKCKNLCGQPCFACKEPCSRRCVHGECSRRCGEVCQLRPCSEPCDKRLPCDHPCRGLCGEPCPPICNRCRPDEFPKDFLGDDFEENDKFIILEDCNHVLELENMDNLMFGDRDTVSIRTCPYCRKPIINTHRYKDFVNDMFKKDINPIKERVYGTETQIRQKKLELTAKTNDIVVKPSTIASDKSLSWHKALEMLLSKLNNKKKVSLLDLEMQCIYLDILQMISDTYDPYITANLIPFKEKLTNQVDMICTVLMNNIQKISQQQQKDIGIEIKRMNSIIQLARIVSHPSYHISKEEPKVKDALANAELEVTGWTVYNETKGIEALKILQDTIKVSGIVTKQERELIVKAIGLKAGHWYKCPNGHYYCIGECGGAMQVGKCVECGAPIGGTSHRLLGTNRHAPEMDGSIFAAWSEEYNNMANFNFD